MSTLTLTLILLVAATLAAVAVVNLLQARRNRALGRPPPRGAANAAGAQGDALRGEPSLALDEAGGPEPDAAHDTQGDQGAVTAAPERGGPGDHPDTEPTLVVGQGASRFDSSADVVAGESGPGVPVTIQDTSAQAAASVAGQPVTQTPGPDPVAATAAAASPASAAAPVAQTEQRAAGGGPAADPPGSARQLPERPALGEQSDCIIELALHAPQSGERLLMQTQSLRRVGAKPILFEGLPRVVSEGGDGRWLPLVAGQQYRSLRAGVLLANRHGPLNAMEFSEFIAGINGLASQLGVTTRNPDMTPVLQRARELDSLCIQLDAQVGVNVDCAQPLIPADLARVAIEQDLAERGNNRYARLNAAGQVLFSVSLADEPNRLTFLLDVPRAPAADKPWQQLVDAAQAIAARLQGALVDDGARPLASPSLARIGEQLAQRYESLEQAGFPAGAALALRLFN